MKRNAFLMTLLLTAVMTLSSCYKIEPRIRKSDVARLTEQAEKGNVDAQRAIFMYGHSKFPAELKEHYVQELAAAGDYYAIDTLLYRDQPKDLETWRKGTPKVVVDWMERGVERGATNFMYRLALEYGKPQSQYRDSLRADQLLRQAADSLHTYARLELREAKGKNTIFDRAVFSYQQIWSHDMADESLLCRFSNASFQASYGFFSDSFLKIFSHIWWQCILAIAVMIVGLLAALLFFFLVEKNQSFAAVTSSVYGMLNGFVLFFVGHYVLDDGLLRTNRCIGQFTLQDGTFGWESTTCLWASWVWLVLLIFFLAKGLYDLRESGRMNAWQVIRYVLTFIFVNLVYYIMFSTVALFGQLMIFITCLLLALMVLDKLGILKILGSIKVSNMGGGGSGYDRAMKDYHDAMDRQRMRDINNKIWGH